MIIWWMYADEVRSSCAPYLSSCSSPSPITTVGNGTLLNKIFYHEHLKSCLDSSVWY